VEKGREKKEAIGKKLLMRTVQKDECKNTTPFGRPHLYNDNNLR
jgi:hypothetical protein